MNQSISEQLAREILEKCVDIQIEAIPLHRTERAAELITQAINTSREADKARIEELQSELIVAVGEISALKAEVIEQAALISVVLMPLRAKHYPSECSSCREEKHCEHKRLMDLSVRPRSPGFADKVLALVPDAHRIAELRDIFKNSVSITLDDSEFWRVMHRLADKAEAFTPDELKLLGVGE